MKIIQISPVDLPVRKDLMCGGTQRIALNLDSSYTKRGIDSYVIGTSDSEIQGKLLPTTKEPLWEYEREVTDREKKITKETHCRRALEYILNINPDIIHDQARFVCSNVYKEEREKIKSPIIVNFHSNFINESEIEHLKQDESIWLVALSNHHKKLLEKSGLNVKEVIYHGLDINEYPFEENKKDYLFSIGRIVPDKGQDIAIRVAKKTGKGLIIAGKILPYNNDNNKWWKKEVLPYIDGFYKVENLEIIKEIIENIDNKIVYVNGLKDNQKKEFYKHASCLIAPSKNEAFGLTIIEAFATGTPAIVLKNTALPELIINGKNGYLAENEEEMVGAVKNLKLISPYKCRETIEKKFSLEKQVDNYLRIYQKAISNYQACIVY